MRKKYFRLEICVAAIPWLLVCLHVSSSTAAGFSISADKGELQYHMKEVNSSGGLLNREDGTLPVLRMGVEAMLEEKSVSFDFWQSEGLVPYFGMTQVGYPLITFTRLDIRGVQLRAQKSFNWNATSSYGVSLGVSNTQVDRSILPSFGSLPLREKLDSTQAVMGTSAQMQLFQLRQHPLSFSAEINLLPALRNRLLVDSFGLYDPITLKPALNVDWNAKAKLSYRPSPWFGLWLTLQRQSLTPGATGYQTWNKGGVPSVSVRYPGSQQFLNQITMGCSIHF
jgi:hypothetical protein